MARKAEGATVTDWIDSAIRAKLDGPPATHELSPDAVGYVKPRSKAQEIAGRFGGLVTTAAQLEQNGSAAAEQRSAEPVFVGYCPVEDVSPKRDWLQFYRELAEMEPAEAGYAFDRGLSGLTLPSGFRRLPTPKQIQWLQANA